MSTRSVTRTSKPRRSSALPPSTPTSTSGARTSAAWASVLKPAGRPPFGGQIGGSFRRQRPSRVLWPAQREVSLLILIVSPLRRLLPLSPSRGGTLASGILRNAGGFLYLAIRTSTPRRIRHWELLRFAPAEPFITAQVHSRVHLNNQSNPTDPYSTHSSRNQQEEEPPHDRIRRPR